jgi:hypothetical protein
MADLPFVRVGGKRLYQLPFPGSKPAITIWRGFKVLKRELLAPDSRALEPCFMNQ